MKKRKTNYQVLSVLSLSYCLYSHPFLLIFISTFLSARFPPQIWGSLISVLCCLRLSILFYVSHSLVQKPQWFPVVYQRKYKLICLASKTFINNLFFKSLSVWYMEYTVMGDLLGSVICLQPISPAIFFHFAT